ncbi:hypothetical protein GCM10010124_28330 [Pilimelia terevasa]|uniref:GAF domain-containing protein n=1 Tax=Pilimelia terevasa TaxID=53372 RepID=A0A8J3FJL5_9ACTN|nr:GAF domain-containing protein [Pilimelia terevasa]GGK34064.1 hypothetical protein GCM10010124_28330 [Pilimelia terevasa]
MTATAGAAALTDPRRLAAVHRHEILDAPADGAFDRIAHLAARVCDTPVATVSIVDADRVWFAASAGLDGVTQVGTEPGLCASAFLADGLYVVGDAAVDPRTVDHPLVRGELGLRFYAAAPLVTGDGHRLGTVAVLDVVPRELDATRAAVLADLAALVTAHLALRLDALRAVRAERELREEAQERAAAAGALAARLRAGAAAQREVPRPPRCQLGGTGRPCAGPAELKVADSWGVAAWGCHAHVEEALLHVRSVFVASEDPDGLGGLGGYLRRA